jgi:hypothetical protein
MLRICDKDILTLYRILEDSENPEAAELYNTLQKQRYIVSRTDVGLLDQVADYLTDVNLHHTNAAEVLQYLRDVILTPREYTEFEAKITSAQLECGACKRIILNGEAASFANKKMYCANCVTSLFVTCVCGSKHALTKQGACLVAKVEQPDSSEKQRHFEDTELQEHSEDAPF